MATIKSYTDIEQSKKLAEILPTESADMYWRSLNLNGHISWSSHIKRLEPPIYDLEHYIPCWSLAALLGVIPKQIKNNVLRVDIDEKNFSIWYDELGYGVNSELPDIIMECPVDACVELIIKLHELKML